MRTLHLGWRQRDAILAWRPELFVFAGDTIYAWSEVIDKAELPGRRYMGALRTRLFAVKDRACADFPGQKPDGGYEDGVVLDLDCWIALPR